MSHSSFGTILRRFGTGALTLALAALVVLLAVENRRLERALQIAGERSASGLAVGDRLPGFDVVPIATGTAADTATGTAADTAASDDHLFAAGDLRNAALFFFTTSCNACEQNLDAWARLNEQLAGSHIVVGIGLDDGDAVRSYASRHDLPFEVMAARDAYLAESLGIPGVPMTVVVDGDGRVSAREVGVLPDGWSPKT